MTRHTSKVFFFHGKLSCNSETWLELIVLEIELKMPLLPDEKFASCSCWWRRRHVLADENNNKRRRVKRKYFLNLLFEETFKVLVPENTFQRHIRVFGVWSWRFKNQWPNWRSLLLRNEIDRFEAVWSVNRDKKFVDDSRLSKLRLMTFWRASSAVEIWKITWIFRFQCLKDLVSAWNYRFGFIKT